MRKVLPSGKQFAGQNIRVGDIRYWWDDAGNAPNVQVNPESDDGGYVKLLFRADLESGPCWVARPIASWRPAGIAVEGVLFLFHHHDDYMKTDVYVRADKSWSSGNHILSEGLRMKEPPHELDFAHTTARIRMDEAAARSGLS
jgi:hypothetical protein